jgi:hypothetical protein
VIGIDLAEDKQALAVIDHDVRVLARKTVRVKAFRLGEAMTRIACAASLLRWIYCMVVHGTSWDPAASTGTRRISSR